MPHSFALLIKHTCLHELIFGHAHLMTHSVTIRLANMFSHAWLLCTIDWTDLFTWTHLRTRIADDSCFVYMHALFALLIYIAYYCCVWSAIQQVLDHCV